jgi:hypothetical protein
MSIPRTFPDPALAHFKLQSAIRAAGMLCVLVEAGLFAGGI